MKEMIKMLSNFNLDEPEVAEVVKMRQANLSNYRGQPDDLELSSKDVMKIFGYNYGYSAGFKRYLPTPLEFVGDKSKKGNYKYYWLLGDLRKLELAIC